jgi:hypothetical protein
MSDDLDEGPIDYDHLKVAANHLRRPVHTLFALSAHNDPFYITPARQKAAQWFADLWTRLSLGPIAHIRRVHYRLVSSTALTLPNGNPFENTEGCWNALCAAGRDARYLGLIQKGSIIDRRNPEPMFYYADPEEKPATMTVSFSGVFCTSNFEFKEPALLLPRLQLVTPTIGQRYVVELWCEKSTINDILMPLGDRYHVNVVTGIDEMTATRCEELVARIRKYDRPTRVLYLSDFDPGGLSMPTAVARKVEFTLRSDPADDDVQVRPIALTAEQCAIYGLPRIPLKETEVRAAKFEERHGEGGTELDALEALHPGELERILSREIARYHDDTLDLRVGRMTNRVQADLFMVTRDVHARDADELAVLEEQRVAIGAEIARMRERIETLEAALKTKARPLFDTIADELETEAPGVNDYDWPEPKDGDEDPDPLFDSSRNYMDQLARYRGHQGKPENAGFHMHQKICEGCGTTFEARRRDATVCSKRWPRARSPSSPPAGRRRARATSGAPDEVTERTGAADTAREQRRREMNAEEMIKSVTAAVENGATIEEAIEDLTVEVFAQNDKARQWFDQERQVYLAHTGREGTAEGFGAHIRQLVHQDEKRWKQLGLGDYANVVATITLMYEHEKNKARRRRRR